MKQTIETLTAQSFAPYGRLLEQVGDTPTKAGSGWRCFSQVDFLQPHNAPLGVGIVYCGELPGPITELERHVSREELLWATGSDLLMCVDVPMHLGTPNARPSVETAKVFRIKAGQAVIIARGTWHSPAFAEHGEAKYFFLVESAKDLVDQDDAPWIPFRDGGEITVG